MESLHHNDHDANSQKTKERKLKLSSSSPQDEDRSQTIKDILSELSLPTPQPLEPNRPDRPIGGLPSQTFYKAKRQKSLEEELLLAFKRMGGSLIVAAPVVFGIWAIIFL